MIAAVAGSDSLPSYLRKQVPIASTAPRMASCLRRNDEGGSEAAAVGMIPAVTAQRR